MESFTPQSNKRTAGLPSPCPIGLKNHCSTAPGSLPLGPGRAPAQHQIQAPLRYLQVRLCGAPDPHRIHTPLGSLPLKSPAPQALLGPSLAWNNQSSSPLGPPIGPCRNTTPPGSPPIGARHQLSVRHPHSPACRGSCPSGLSQVPALHASQITALTGSSSGCQ
jgi:hypothetical protein